MNDSGNEIATIYCDESGNTGPDLLSKSDPFFVFAWVLLTKDQEANVASKISDLLKKEGLPLSTELHSVTMWQSTRGLRRWDEVFRILHNAGGTVFITYSEKVFELCVFIVETYLDPDHNPEVRGHLPDIEFKRLLGNTIRSSISEDLLRFFLKACNADDIAALKSFGTTLARLLALHPDNRISSVARVVNAGLDNFYRFGERIQNAPANMHLTSGHITLFSLPLLYINEKLDNFQLKARLVRDKDLQFGEALDLAYKTLSELSPDLWNIVSSEEGKSSQLRGLQIADLAAGITARVLRAKYAKHSLKPNQWAIWKSLRGSLLWGTWSYQLTSNECEARLLPLWNDDYPNESWYEGEKAEVTNDLAKCSCGQTIPSRKLRDFYLHVLEHHPDSHVMGVPCSICNELIPFGLDACHQIIEHGIKPPFRGDFYGEMQSDYEVLQRVKKRGLKIVLPRIPRKEMDIDKAD
jgi:hypothetical protein